MTETKEAVAGLDVEMTGTVILNASDDQKFTLERKSAFIAKLVSQALENGTVSA